MTTTPKPILVYLAHPVGAPDAAGVEANLGRARRWLSWLVDLPSRITDRIAWCAPWWAYVASLEDAGAHCERGLRDTLAALERCDAIVALGRLTPGMTLELAAANRLGLPVVDLVALGALPPPTSAPSWWTTYPAADAIAVLEDLVAKVDRRRAAQVRDGGL